MKTVNMSLTKGDSLKHNLHEFSFPAGGTNTYTNTNNVRFYYIMFCL